MSYRSNESSANWENTETGRAIKLKLFVTIEFNCCKFSAEYSFYDASFSSFHIIKQMATS